MDMIGKVLRRVRKNHGLEHATVTVLMEKGVRPPMGGYSTPGGFFIFSKASEGLVSESVIQAYSRMAAGEHDLAVSPYCGTNLATGMLLGSFLFGRMMGKRSARGKLLRLPVALVAFGLGMALGRPVGNALQRRFTTLGDVSDGEVLGISSFGIGPFSIQRVRTRYSDLG